MPAPAAFTFHTEANLHHGRFQAMASPCEVLIAGGSPGDAERLCRQAAQEAWRIERKFSRYRDDNIIARINQARGRPVALDGETARLVDYARQCWQLSEGRFDISSGILRRVWRFDGSDRLPMAEDIEALLPLIGWQRARWDGRQLALPPGMEIDLGGIGKEYAVDRVLERLCEQCTHPLLVNFGGDLRASAPRSSGQPWSVGVEGVDESAPDAHIALEQGALATSGDARRFLLRDGQRYSHVLDPRSGWPVTGAPRSVTVAAPTCSEAGFLATLALLHGPDAEDFLQAQGLPYWLRR